ncbi:IS3 family transposase [Nocardia sp. R6R-6]|uniref:IS3 family transposase n=1 Tax=Nocardia sp. R6R-6 TaxID=3459303 RepID=UPI00403E177D
MGHQRRKYSPEYKDEAVKMVLENPGRSIAAVARDLGINEGTLGNWVALHRKKHPVEDEPLTISERARLRELERENRELRMTKDFLGKSGSLLREPPAVKYDFIAEMDAEKAYPVAFMCKKLNVSRSGYYEWRVRPISKTEKWREDLKSMIAAIFDDSHGTYGHRRIHAVLVVSGYAVDDDTVRRLMRELDLVPCQPRPWRPSTTEADIDHRIPDLVRRDFTAGAPGEKFVSDITYIRTAEGWLYLATVIDCHTKMVAGWSMADHYRTPLIEAALDMAANRVDVRPGAIFHSDRGSNYTSYDFGKKLKKMDMRQSVGRTGVCWDNSMAESFFGALKNEWLHRMTFVTRDQARRAIVEYIEVFYNRKRLHSGLGYKAPLQVHADYLNRQSAA